MTQWRYEQRLAGISILGISIWCWALSYESTLESAKFQKVYIEIIKKGSISSKQYHPSDSSTSLIALYSGLIKMIYLNATNFNREWKKPIFENNGINTIFLHSSRPVNGEGYSEWFKRDQNISRTLFNLKSEN